jgi:hypothetical protein
MGDKQDQPFQLSFHASLVEFGHWQTKIWRRKQGGWGRSLWSRLKMGQFPVFVNW